MELSADVRDRISNLVTKQPVVLFMKGSRSFPQCGFSAAVVQILEELIPDGYETVNVLEDASIREGIKVFSNWPTIPQLYVKGEFIGGCDIVRDMHASGDLHKTLGVEFVAPAPPAITITDTAAAALRDALTDADPNHVLHVEVSARWDHGLQLGAPDPSAFALEVNGLKLSVSRAMARKLDGLVIDFVSEGGQTGFRIDNPNAPPKVKSITPAELKAKLDAGEPLELFDVRTPRERDIASIDGSRLLDDEAQRHIAALDKSTMIVFMCHTGARSGRAAMHFLQQGYTNVYNLIGGIAAWSKDVDPSVPTY